MARLLHGRPHAQRTSSFVAIASVAIQDNATFGIGPDESERGDWREKYRSVPPVRGYGELASDVDSAWVGGQSSLTSRIQAPCREVEGCGS